MKIVNSINAIFHDKEPHYLVLQNEVDKVIRNQLKPSWHYVSRVKSKESFALKLETGRCPDPNNLEDFFAATIVVENIGAIQDAIAYIQQFFEIKYRRPEVDHFTSKRSNAFPFDDLRLYVQFLQLDYAAPKFPGVIFEIQIKTFLQHAWSVSTHDLIYKSGTVNWSKERIAFQIKAMLEQAELSIYGVDALSGFPLFNKDNRESQQLNAVLEFIRETFPETSLPNDCLRLAQIVSDVLLTFKMNLEELITVINAETNLKRGIHTLDLSPYAIIIQSIIYQLPDKFQKAFLKKARTKLDSIFVPREIDLGSLKIENTQKIIRS